jgi:hypothetical protein
MWADPNVMQSAPASYGRAVRSVNSDLALRTLEATFLFWHRTCEDLGERGGRRRVDG